MGCLVLVCAAVTPRRRDLRSDTGHLSLARRAQLIALMCYADAKEMFRPETLLSQRL
jgi:hypothetical protein